MHWCKQIQMYYFSFEPKRTSCSQTYTPSIYPSIITWKLWQDSDILVFFPNRISRNVPRVYCRLHNNKAPISNSQESYWSGDKLRRWHIANNNVWAVKLSVGNFIKTVIHRMGLLSVWISMWLYTVCIHYALSPETCRTACTFPQKIQYTVMCNDCKLDLNQQCRVQTGGRARLGVALVTSW